MIAGRGVGQVPHLLGDADPPLRPVVAGLALVFEFSHEVPGVIGLPSCHGHDPLVLDDTLAWASVRKCPLNPAVVMPAVRPGGEEETRRIGPPCI